jgi:2',3'-cyclic-nucleotide 2'-phosphodiesterase/3'-nucleotidase
MSLTGEEIRDYLEFSSSNWFNQMSDSSDDLLMFKHNEDGSIKYSSRTNTPETKHIFYNFSSAAGINYTVDVSKPAGGRITITTLSDGRSFNLDETYTVAINSYRGSGGGGLMTLGADIPQDELAERIMSSTDRDIRYNLIQWIKDKKIIKPHLIGNWNIIPEAWWQKGKEKDYKLLFGKDYVPAQTHNDVPIK